MRLVLVLGVVVALAVVAAQLNASRLPADSSATTSHIDPVLVGTSFPEPISTVFVLGGAAALGLWRLARKLQIV